MTRRTTPLLLAAACLLLACTDSKTPKVPPSVPTPKAEAPAAQQNSYAAAAPSTVHAAMRAPQRLTAA